jgi:hypothetical protein
MALDNVFDKHFSRQTVQRLRSKGYRAKSFGVRLKDPRNKTEQNIAANKVAGPPTP